MAGNVSHSAGSICFLHHADDGTVHTCNPVLYRRGGCQLSGWEGGLSLLCTPPPCPHSARHTPSRRAMLPWSPAWDSRVDTLVAFILSVLNTYVGQTVSLLCLPRWAGRSGRFSARSDVRRRLPGMLSRQTWTSWVGNAPKQTLTSDFAGCLLYRIGLTPQKTGAPPASPKGRSRVPTLCHYSTVAYGEADRRTPGRPAGVLCPSIHTWALSASCDRNEATSSRRAAPSIPREDRCYLTAHLGLR